LRIAPLRTCLRSADTEDKVKASDSNLTKVPSTNAQSAVAPGIELPYLAGRYFTNGAALYRVAGWQRRPGEPARVEFEDCATLHLALLTRQDLAMMALRPVAPAVGAAQ
jgi:hypothetical protein